MSWSPLERDRRKLAALDSSSYDFTEGSCSQTRERILELREAIEAGDFADLALELEHAQRAAAARLSEYPTLHAVVAAFEELADRLADLARLEDPSLVVGAMANVEAAAAALEARLAELEPQADG